MPKSAISALKTTFLLKKHPNFVNKNFIKPFLKPAVLIGWPGHSHQAK
jgi:hypothetical protein